MGISESVDRIRAWFSRALPVVARWLWFVAAFAFAVGQFEMDQLGELLESTSNFFSEAQFTPWLVGTFCFSLLFVLANWRKWRIATWLCLASWVFALGALLVWLQREVAMPGVYDLVSLEAMIAFDYWSYISLPLSMLSLSLMIVMAALLVVLWALMPSESTDGHPIGGRWKTVWAWLLGLFVYALLTTYNPVTYLAMYSTFEHSFLYADANSLLDSVLKWIAWISPLCAGFLVAAWKSRATATFGEKRLTIGLGEGLPLFSVAWDRVLSVTELAVPGRSRSIVVEHGVLPWYRFRFGLHERRDGAEVIGEVLERTGDRKRGVRVRRGTTAMGVAMIFGSFVCMKVIERLVMTGSERMAEESVDIVGVFVSSGYFWELTLLQLGASVFFGGGVALALARNYGGVRFLPLLCVGLGATMMGDPLIYWLVYIAIFAILTARLGPVEFVPHVPFPDDSLVTFGLWSVSYKMQIAVCAYLVFALVAVRPWYRAVPSWPYRWRKRTGPVESEEPAVQK